MKKTNKFIIIISMLIAISCSNESKTDHNSVTKSSKDVEITTKTEESVVHNQERYFNIKSGHIKYSTNTAGQELIREWWFDDYGNKQYEENYLVIDGKKSGDKALMIDGFKYKWNFDATNGTKTRYYQAKTNYNQISEKDIERFGIKKHGFEVFMGKECLKVSTEKPKSISWVWENIVLKSETEIGGQKVIMQAIDINEEQPSASLFELPLGISFEEK
ncbi:MAG: hypothetical protein Fur0028_02390 [Bacteroidales bacterium]